MNHAYYSKRAAGSALTPVTPAAVWSAVSAIGGENSYYYLEPFWKARELIDRIAGGVRSIEQRRHPSELSVGDTIDFWRVMEVDPGCRLALEFGMKGPGEGVLEFVIAPPVEVLTRLTVTGWWHPHGMPGHLYWHALQPLHLLVFNGMAQKICRQAENQSG